MDFETGAAAVPQKVAVEGVDEKDMEDSSTATGAVGEYESVDGVIAQTEGQIESSRERNVYMDGEQPNLIWLYGPSNSVRRLVEKKKKATGYTRSANNNVYTL